MAALAVPHWATLAWFFALGCVVGSALNVVIYRLPRGMELGRPRRSFCPHCGHPIRWRDNIPLVSFALLRRRCRDCGSRISWQYPIVEGLTGALFALIYYRQRLVAGVDMGQVTVMMLLTSLLIVASAVDVEFLIIPDEISAFGAAGGLLAGFLMPQLHVGGAPYHTLSALTGWARLDGLIASAMGCVAGGLLVWFFGLVGRAIFRREALGFGDVKLMAMVGAFFGWKVALVAFFLSPFIGLLYGLPLLLAKGQHVMPYGPFLSLGTVVALVFRTELCAYVQPLQELVGLLGAGAA